MQRKTVFFAGALLCLFILVAAGFYWYNKPRAGVDNERAAYSMTAAGLYQSFQQDEKKAEQQYSGKIIEVTGVIDNIERSGNTTSILLSAGDPVGGVNCSLAENQAGVSLPAKGTGVRIKGRCTGFLIDVNLVDAVLLK